MSQPNQGQDLQAAITKFIWKNENLRGEFVKDPKAALEKYIGVKVPDGVNVKCIDATDAKTVYFVLPHHPSKALGVEFTDEQLDAVAGGFSLGGLIGGVAQTGMGIVGGLLGSI